MNAAAHSSDPNNSLVVCHECEHRVHIPSLQHKQKALCPRCGYKLAAHRNYAEQWIAALSITAIVFLVLSLPFEFLAFEAQGQGQSISIPSGLWVLVENEYLSLAIIQLLAIVILPALVLLGLVYLCLPLSIGKRPLAAEYVLEWIFKLLPWSMAEIFIIGVIVSLIKIVSLADVTLGPSFFAYIGFTLCMTWMLTYLDKHQLAELLKCQMSESSHNTAHQSPIDASKSIQKTWALLITSIILYIPANTLPMMYTRFLGQDEPSTIIGGVIELWRMGSYPIAAVIFIASVFVPVAKIVILIWLNTSVQRGSLEQHNERVFWYRVTEFVGRWSMVDVFVVAILVSLIQLGNAMSIYPGPAALAFCAVVIMTMLAAMTFDSRLIWIGESKNE